MEDPVAHTVTLIRTRLLARGEGTPDDPKRVVEQFWTADGKLVVEKDPFSNTQWLLGRLCQLFEITDAASPEHRVQMVLEKCKSRQEFYAQSVSSPEAGS